MYGKFDAKTAEKLLPDLKRINPEIDILFDNSIMLREVKLMDGNELQTIFNEAENRESAHSKIREAVKLQLRPIKDISVAELKEAAGQYLR